MAGRAHDVMIMKTCHALAVLGHNLKIITGKPAKDKNIFDYYGLEPVPRLEIIRVPMLRGNLFSWHAIFNFFCLLKLISMKKEGNYVVYLREMKLARFLLKFKGILGIPFVIEVHDLKIKQFYDSCPERNRTEDYVFRKADGIIVLLDTFGNILKETYKISNTPVVKVPLAAEKVPFSYNPSGRKIIGYIGQLYPMQGVEILIEAITYLPDARLSIIGGRKEDINRLTGFAADKKVGDRVSFHGFVPPNEVAEKAKEADVMVICALNRGKRRYSAHTKLYEYMAIGKPIIAVDIPSIREEVADGKDALLVRPEDPKGLADAIERVLNNQRLAGSLAAEAYKSADEFTWGKRAMKLSDFFQKVWSDFQKK